MKGVTKTSAFTAELGSYDDDDDDDDDDPSNRSAKSVAGVSASMIRATSSRQQMEQTVSTSFGVWFPWDSRYKLWWGFIIHRRV